MWAKLQQQKMKGFKDQLWLTKGGWGGHREDPDQWMALIQGVEKWSQVLLGYDVEYLAWQGFTYFCLSRGGLNFYERLCFDNLWYSIRAYCRAALQIRIPQCIYITCTFFLFLTNNWSPRGFTRKIIGRVFCLGSKYTFILLSFWV